MNMQRDNLPDIHILEGGVGKHLQFTSLLDDLTVLKKISSYKILNDKGLILVETSQLLNVDELNLKPIFSKKIGSSYLQCFKKLLNPLK